MFQPQDPPSRYRFFHCISFNRRCSSSFVFQVKAWLEGGFLMLREVQVRFICETYFWAFCFTFLFINTTLLLTLCPQPSRLSSLEKYMWKKMPLCFLKTALHWDFLLHFLVNAIFSTQVPQLRSLQCACSSRNGQLPGVRRFAWNSYFFVRVWWTVFQSFVALAITCQVDM